MGPEGHSSLNPLQFTDKVPPSFDGYGDYQQYRENVVLWDAMTSISAPRRAPTIIGQLTGQAQITAKTLPLAELTSESGVTSLIREMDKKFGLDTVTLLHNNISDFFDYNWDHTMSVEEFVVGFHSRLDRISKLDMNDELKGHLLLKQANLDSHDRNLVVGAAGGDYTLQALATSLRNAFRTEGLPPASMNCNPPRLRYPSPILRNSGSGRASRNHGSKSSPGEQSTGGPMFYTYMSVDNANDTPSAIIDSGSCCSVVGKVTLDRAMRKLGLDKLIDEDICQQEHLFGPSNNLMKTLCAVRVPFTCSSPHGGKVINFDIRFDVIDGTLPFLIGLPSLVSMKASLNFRYSNISIIIDRVIYRLQLVKRSSHLELPLNCNIVHQRSLRVYNEQRGENNIKQNHHSWNLQRSYYNPAAEKTMHSFKSNKLLSSSELQKLHEQLGHATATRMKTFLREAQTWDPSYSNLIDIITTKCTCVLASPPEPRPVCAATATPECSQTHLSIDILFFNRKPFLHVIDDRTKWSEVGALRTRRLCDQIDVLKRIQFYRHGIPEVIRGDQEYNKDEFLKFCRSFDIKFNSVAANHHEGNAIVERANRSIRDHVNRMALAEPQASLVQRVLCATFHKNTSRGHNKASSFELLYNRVPKLSTICNPTEHGTAEDNIVEARRRQLRAALNSKRRTAPTVREGDSVYFWRDNNGWTGPGSVIETDGRIVHIKHNDLIKTADLHRVRHAPRRNYDSDDSSQNDELSTIGCNNSSDSPTSPNAATVPIAKAPRNRRTQAQILADENKALMEDLPEKRVNQAPQQESHMATLNDNQNATQINELSVEERHDSYNRERDSWTINHAFERVSRNAVSASSNIIGSHVVYRRKADGTPKARIVPWGHRDMEKDDLRGDAPSLNLDSMRLLLSIAAERRWTVRKMDVKSAYLQAKGFTRDIYVRPPREENDVDGLWKLLVPAYGLTDSGRLWYLTSYEALTTRYGFKALRLDPSLYLRTSENGTLLLVVQVDDYLYAGSPQLASDFEKFLHDQFQIGSMEHTSFTIMGAHLTQDDSGKITINAKEKLSQIQTLETGRPHKDKDRIATPEEITTYRSVVGKLLYIGRLVSPVIAFHASQAAMKCSDLRLHHLRALNATLRTIKKSSCAITYLPSDNQPFELEAMSDASMQMKDEKTNVREGIIIFRRSQNIVHAIGWVSRLARRVARSTSTAELLAAADAVDKLTFFKYLLQEFSDNQTTELILDSRSAFHLCSTQKEPEEVKNKIILASIREEYHLGSMTTIRWTPGQSHLADALTKDNQEIAKLLDGVMESGIHSHPDSSYTATSDLPDPSVTTHLAASASPTNQGQSSDQLHTYLPQSTA